MAVVFDADFTSSQQWVAGRTSSYPDMGPTNRGDHKLDRLIPAFCPGGVFSATRGRFSRLWNCNLLTTEGSPEGFQLRSGDLLRAEVVLPTGIGAWPAIWTWRDGGNEVDIFEYHPDHPDLLEFSNHLADTNLYWHGSSAGVAPGATVRISTSLGADSVEWYVGDTLCYADGSGVGADWSAYLIVNLSVSDGTYHPAPSFWGPRRLGWTCQSLQVER